MSVYQIKLWTQQSLLETAVGWMVPPAIWESMWCSFTHWRLNHLPHINRSFPVISPWFLHCDPLVYFWWICLDFIYVAYLTLSIMGSEHFSISKNCISALSAKPQLAVTSQFLRKKICRVSMEKGNIDVCWSQSYSTLGCVLFIRYMLYRISI